MSLNKITQEPRSMISLPTGIKLEVLHFIRDSILIYPFLSDPILAMQHAAICKHSLLAVALLNPDWTEVAQSQLFLWVSIVTSYVTLELCRYITPSSSKIYSRRPLYNDNATYASSSKLTTLISPKSFSLYPVSAYSFDFHRSSQRHVQTDHA